MNPAMHPTMQSAMLPGTMPYGAAGQHPYPVASGGYHGVHPAGVHPGQYPHSPMWGHHKGYHKGHHGGYHKPGVLAVGLTAVGMGLVGHKAQKKMRKKMKKAQKVHKLWHHGYGKVSLS